MDADDIRYELDLELRELEFSRARSHEMPPGVRSLTRVLLEERRVLAVGDSLCDRNGLRVLVESIVPEDEMPRLSDGSRADVILPWDGSASPSLVEAYLTARPERFDPAAAPLSSSVLVESERAAGGVLYLFKVA